MNIRWLQSHSILVASLATVILITGLLVVLVVRQQQDQAADNGKVYLEAAGAVGANPFVPLIAPPETTGEDAGIGDPATAAPSSPGTEDVSTCDPEGLIAFLSAHPTEAAEWAGALNSDPTLTWSGGSQIKIEQIPTFIRELTPRLLFDDLRVTNYQFTNGKALAVQSVLQKGTAVLVDTKGVSRVRCACGNPLKPMIQFKTPPVYHGPLWRDFQPTPAIQRAPAIQHAPVIQQAPAIQEEPEVQHEPEAKHEPEVQTVVCSRHEYYDGQRCQPTSVCPKPQVQDDNDRCVDPPCPRGQTRDSNSRCSDQPCPHGQTRDAGGSCPERPPVTDCPDGSKPPNGGECSTTRTCPDGSTQPVGQPCHEQPTTKNCTSGHIESGQCIQNESVHPRPEQATDAAQPRPHPTMERV